jgi:DNA-binding NarL/FixJ family response regulator
MAAALVVSSEISLAIIHIMMPGIGGLDVANQLAMDLPSTKVLYVSGSVRAWRSIVSSTRTPERCC